MFARGSGKEGMEEIVPGLKLNLNRLTSIEGRVYAVGTDREVYRRTDVQKWEELRTGIPRPKSPNEWKLTGFNDVSRFNENDLYAVGGKGDVWRFASGRWVQCSFPSNIGLFNVCCASDGNVYIGAEDGTIFVGADDRWKVLWHGEHAVPYNDLVWFQNSLCLASDYGFYRLVDNEIRRSSEEPYFGYADSRDGVLLVSSLQTAWLYNGLSWRTVLAPYN